MARQQLHLLKQNDEEIIQLKEVELWFRTISILLLSKFWKTYASIRGERAYRQ